MTAALERFLDAADVSGWTGLPVLKAVRGVVA